MTLVRSKAERPDGTPVAGVRVAASLTPKATWLADGTAQIITVAETTTSATGAWALNLIPQSELEMPDSAYRIQVGGWTFYVQVPVSGPVELRNILVDPATLDPVSPPLPGLYLTQTEADTRYVTHSELGQPDGVAPLGADGKVPADNLPPASAAGGGVTSYNDLTDKPTIPDSPDDIGAQPAGNYATADALAAELATKQPVGDYATNQALTDGLATKQAAGDYATNTALTSGLATKADARKFLKTWRAAYGNRWYAKCNVVCLGASETEGFNGPTDFYQSWTPMLAKRLQQPAGGVGFIHPVPNFTATWWPCTVTGTNGPSPGYEFGPNHQAWYLSTGGVATYTVKGTSVDVMYIATPAANGGVMSVSIDGGAATNINTGTATANTDGTMQRFSLGASGTHTVKISYVSGSAVYLDGLIVYDGDESKGVTVHRVGANGWSTSQYIAGTTNNYAKAVAALKPHLIVITQGVNDLKQNRTVAQFKTDLNTMITQLRAAITGPQPDIVLHAMYTPSGMESTWPPYVAAMKDLAASLGAGVGFLDESQRMPGGADTTLAMTSDGTHPTAKGASTMADSMTTYLLNDT